MKTYDYILIGAGSAGCVLAYRLTENPDVQVLLLEAGGPDDDPNIHLPAGWPATFRSQSDWAYMTEPQVHANNQRIPWPRGKTLGGTSAINAMIYVRGHHSDYDDWAYQGCAGWNSEAVLEVFKKSEDYELGPSKYHGIGGPLRVEKLKSPNPVLSAVVEAGKELGYPYIDDFNSEPMEGIGWCDVTIKDGKRYGTATAFLRPALQRPNLTVISKAAAQRLLFKKNRCVGVEYLDDGKVKQAHSDIEVIVTSGSIGSPQLLLHSGIGDATELQELGIKVVSHLSGVGKNLQDHLLVPVIFEAKQAIPAPNNNLLEAQMFAKSDRRCVGPDLQPVFLTIPYYVEGFSGPANAYTLIAGMIRPASRGYLKLRSTDPSEPPMLNPNYLSAQADMKALLAVVKICRELGHASTMADWNAGEVWPGKHVISEKNLRDYICRAITTYHHQAGTCKMGIDTLSVVDPELRVYGVDGLRVADASIMPSITSGNTNAPTIMIAEKAAELITCNA